MTRPMLRRLTSAVPVRATGDFLAANPDGTIRTFFRPNTAEAYFRRQAQRSDPQ